MGAFVYILQCANGSYYVGLTRQPINMRVGQHQAGAAEGYTKSRRPVELVFAEEFPRITDAIAMERRLKDWSRAKKEALIRGDFAALRLLARNRAQHPRPSTTSG